MNPVTQSKNTTILPVLIALTLGCFALSPTARAVDPPPDGGYPNENTAEGEGALFDLDTNSSPDNTAIGFNAMTLTQVAFGNTAVGSNALEFSGGNFNVGIGFQTLFEIVGNDNTAVGTGALLMDQFGNNNTAVGSNALSNVTGNSNIGIGESAGINLTDGKNNIDIANAGTAGESARIRIGNNAHKKTFIAGISGVTVAGGVGVIIDTNGQLGTITSSKRFKEAIQPMDKASEAILALKPVTFRYKHELDPDGIPQFGLVAEQVEKVNPDLVARDDQGKPFTVRYEAVNAMLLNEFLKEHRKVEQLEATVANLITTVKEQASEMQKVRAQLELSKSGPQTVLNDH